MTKRPVFLVALAATLILAATPALAASGDAAATRSYIQADYALVHTARANLTTSEAALHKLRSQIAAECPQAAAGSPQDTDSEQLSNELVGAMTLAAIVPDVHAVAAFAHTVQGLHWSNATLTHQSQVLRGPPADALGSARPHVCADVRAWAASSYQTLSASTVSFDSRYYKVEVAVGEVPAGCSRPQSSRRAAHARARASGSKAS